MTMRAIAVPFPGARAESPARGELLGMREEVRAPRDDARLVEVFDAVILEAYGLALTQVQSPRRAEQVTNRVVDRLAALVRRNPAIDEAGLRSAAYQALHKELTAQVRQLNQAQRLQAMRANVRHLFLAGTLAFAVGYTVIAGAM